MVNKFLIADSKNYYYSKIDICTMSEIRTIVDVHSLC